MSSAKRRRVGALDSLRYTRAAETDASFSEAERPAAGAPVEEECSIAPAFVARAPGRWREKYVSPGASEVPLRLLFIGHNPSEHAWRSGHFYSNPSNRMWRLLVESSLLPRGWTCEDDHRAPAELGVGFTDLGTEPGNDAQSYGRTTMLKWRNDLYRRLRNHLSRIAVRIGGVPSAYAPSIVAFTGKRQWAQLFEPPLTRCTFGEQRDRPPRWPFPHSTRVFVLPSSSGRAAMTNEERLAPYCDLAQAVHGIPWENKTTTTSNERH